jgi:hypothetical protein
MLGRKTEALLNRWVEMLSLPVSLRHHPVVKGCAGMVWLKGAHLRLMTVFESVAI